MGDYKKISSGRDLINEISPEGRTGNVTAKKKGLCAQMRRAEIISKPIKTY